MHSHCMEAVSPFVPLSATALHAETASVVKLPDFTEGRPLTGKILQMTYSESVKHPHRLADASGRRVSG